MDSSFELSASVLLTLQQFCGARGEFEIPTTDRTGLLGQPSVSTNTDLLSACSELSLRLIRRYVHAEKRATQIRVHLKDMNARREESGASERAADASASSPRVSLPSEATQAADIAQLPPEQAKAQFAECKIVVSAHCPPVSLSIFLSIYLHLYLSIYPNLRISLPITQSATYERETTAPLIPSSFAYSN